METINIKQLEAEVMANEAKVLYDMYKVTNTLTDRVVTIDSYFKGTSQLTISGKTLTLTYVDGTESTYTEE